MTTESPAFRKYWCVDLNRRVNGAKVHGLTVPLVTDAQGQKFGKSTGGGKLWLDPEKTSPYAWYQYFLYDVTPLVATADLQDTIQLVVQVHVVVGLEQHVGELRSITRTGLLRCLSLTSCATWERTFL
jgi:tyrosyl-tRNA synthetase